MNCLGVNDRHNIIVLHSSMNGVKMYILNLPAAEEEGLVTVEVDGKSEKTGKSSDLGQTKIYYYDERKKVLKQIVQDQEQSRTFFETWKTACEGHSTNSRENETIFPSSGKHERQFDICCQSQVNVEFLVKISRRLLESK